MTPKITLPLAAYVRVSRVGDRDDERLRSPEFQLAAIRRYAEAESFELVEFEPELDVSGGKARRPILDAILAGIRNGTLGGLVVAKLDRLSRLRPRDRVDLFESVEDVGAVILSASEQLDVDTPEGRFARDVFLGVARMQWEKYRDGFNAAKRDAMDRGVPIGPTPFGYARADDGALVEHPEDAPVLTAAFQAAAEAPGSRKVHAALDVLAPHGGRTWTVSTARRLLGKTSYLGEHRYGALRVKVPPLVTRAVWEAAQPEPAKRRRPPGTFPLSGLAECGTCGAPLVGARGGRDAQRMYRCSAALATHKGDRCPKPVSVTADRLEAWAVERINADLQSVFEGVPPVEIPEGEDVQAAEAALGEAEADREAFLASFANLARTLGQEHAERQAAELAVRVEAAQETFRTAAKASQTRTVTFHDRALTLDEIADMRRRHELGIAVFPGRGKPIDERAAVAFGPRLTIRTTA